MADSRPRNRGARTTPRRGNRGSQPTRTSPSLRRTAPPATHRGPARAYRSAACTRCLQTPKYLCQLRYGPARNTVNHCHHATLEPNICSTECLPMTGIEQFRYDGKRALVVGGATGMGAAAGIADGPDLMRAVFIG